MAIAVAAVAVAAAGAAAAAQQARAAGKAADAIGAAGTIPPWEFTYNKGTRDIFNEERGVIEDAIAQGNLMQPEIYRALGFEPVYDSEGPDMDALAGQLNEAKGRVNLAQQKLLDLRHTSPKNFPGGQKGKDEAKRLAGRTRRQAQREADELQQQLSEAQTTGRKVVGLKPLAGGPSDPTQSKDDLFRATFDLENEALARALKGEEPVDATLKTSYDEKERILRERLRRQLGPDYETSTAGAEALANFDRERSEAFAQYNMQATQLYATLTSQRAADLSNLTGARIQQLLAPSTAAIQRGQALGALGKDRLEFTRSQQRERQISLGKAQAVGNAKMAQAAAQGQIGTSIAGAAGPIAGGVSAAAGGLGGGGGLNFGSSTPAAGNAVPLSSVNTGGYTVGGDLNLTA